MRNLGLIILLLSILVSCTTADAILYVTPTDEEVEVVKFGEVRFNGNECEITGQREVPMGRYTISLYDQTDLGVRLYVSSLHDGHTFQDLLDLQPESGVYYPKPDWVHYAVQLGVTNLESDGGKTYIYRLDRKEEHAIYVGSDHPSSLWFCAPFHVVSSTQE